MTKHYKGVSDPKRTGCYAGLPRGKICMRATRDLFQAAAETESSEESDGQPAGGASTAVGRRSTFAQP